MAQRKFDKKPLYRKVNTRTHGVFHYTGPDYRHHRNTKAEKTSEAILGKMKQGVQRGLDYTPLIRFLQSRVGQPFDAVHSEAVARLDSEEPIFHYVARDRESGKAIIRSGESSYYSGLFIDEDGFLQLVDPNLDINDLWPKCPCCTHTFNGEVFPNAYDADRNISSWRASE